MAGCYPGSISEEKAHKRLEGLLDHGIRHVINLMETYEANRSGSPFAPYEPIMESIADTKGLEVSFERMPIRDLNIPTKEEMRSILDAIDENIANDKPVYLHCWGGRGRTGTVVGCYLARHGIAVGKKALWTIQKLRKNVYDFNLASPETHRQIDMVAEWGAGE